MTSPEARREGSHADLDRVTSPATAGAVAVERLNAALYGISVGASTDRVSADALAAAAAALVRIAAGPARRNEREDDTVRRNVAALAASLAATQDEVTALRQTVERLVARVDQLEDRP